MKKDLRKLLALVMVLVLAFTMVACGGGDSETSKDGEKDATEAPAGDDGEDGEESKEDGGSGDVTGKKVGISMPTKDLQRWVQDGENMEKDFKAAGYEVDLQYASNDEAQQLNQIENMISSGCDVLVISAINGDTLGNGLAGAKEKNIPVIAYDRLIMETDAVAYYATFDNYLVGKIQGEYIEEKLDLKNADGPFNIELVTGDPGDNNVNFFFGGAMDILQPYIDEGKLVVKSGQTSKAECATEKWSTETAQMRMENIINANYSDGTKLDAVLASNDSTAQGVANAIASSYKGDFPILTGQDCDIASVKNIIAGKQSMSIFKDTRTLAAKVVEMVTAMLKGEKVPVNDEKTYDNGKGVVPSYLCEPVFADKDNYKELLVDSGYYTEDELK